MAVPWYFIPGILQEIEKYDPDTTHTIKRIGEPTGEYEALQEFMSDDRVVELRANGFIPSGGHVYRLKEEDGSEHYFMAEVGSMATSAYFNPPREG
jgi:hypothetical protein